jgi:hypothetical protein
MEEADIGYEWMAVYATIARRCRDDKDFGFSRYPYEQGHGVGQSNEGYLEHREWPVRRGMERHSSLRPLYEYEAHECRRLLDGISSECGGLASKIPRD